MSEHRAPQEGLLGETEREALTDPEGEVPHTRDELIDKVAHRLWETFGDIELLYMILTEDEFRSAFADTADTRRCVRSRAHHVLAFLYYGLQLTGDDVTYRVASAIETAEAANDRDATVTLDIVTQPFLPPDQQIEALKNGAYEQVTAAALDQLWYDEQVPPADVVDAFAALDETELTVEDVVAERKWTELVERMPTPVITDVEVNTKAPAEDDN